MSNYYAINETAARDAQSMWSFSKYVVGSTTAEYRKQVDECYKLVERLPDELKEKGEALADRFARRLAEWYNKGFRIEMMCPSVMISGAGNFPVRKKEKQNAARERHYREYEQLGAIPNKIIKMINGSDIIKSDDENALEKLQSKVEKLTQNQERYKKMNAYYRKNKTLKGYEGISDDEAVKLDKDIQESYYQVPYAPYVLQNNNANIRRIKERINTIKKLKQQATEKEEITVEVSNVNDSEEKTELFKVVENADLMRLQLIFDGKPEAEIRDILKKNGFRWSPKNGAWQRQLTQNARYAVQTVIKEINDLNK